MHANFPPTSWLVSAGAARGRFGVLEGRLQLVHKLWRAYQAHRDFLAVEKLRACTYNLLRALTRSCAGRRPSAGPRSRLATRPGAMRARTVTSVGSPGVCQCPPHEPSFAQISLPALDCCLMCDASPSARSRTLHGRSTHPAGSGDMRQCSDDVAAHAQVPRKPLKQPRLWLLENAGHELWLQGVMRSRRPWGVWRVGFVSAGLANPWYT